MRIHSPAFNREKLSSVKADVESVEQETEANMHSLLLMDRNVVLHPPPPLLIRLSSTKQHIYAVNH